jgi:hypothetical protein
MRSQTDESADPIEIIRRLNEREVRYLLIGAMALAMYDVPVGSADWDFWIHGEDREKAYEIFTGFGLSGNYDRKEKIPKEAFVDDDGFKVDVFFVKDFKHKRKDMNIAFQDVYSRAVIREDPDGGFFVRILALDDLLRSLEVIDEPRYQHLKRMEYISEILKKRRKNPHSSRPAPRFNIPG